MKKSAVQVARQSVQDNKEYITGNIADYLHNEVTQDANSFFCYLTDETIEEMDGNASLWHEKEEEVKEMLYREFNYDISEFEY